MSYAGGFSIGGGSGTMTGLAGDTGTATPLLGVITIAGGTNLTSVGSGSTITVNLDAALTGITSVDFANGGRLGTGLTAGDTLLLRAYDVDGTAYVTFATLTANDTPTMDLDDAVTKAGEYIYRASGTDVPVADGGTGASTLTQYGVLVGAGTGAVSGLTAGTDGQVLVGSTGANPVMATLGSTGGTISYTPGAGSLNLDVNTALTGRVSIDFATGGRLGTGTTATNTLLLQAYDVDGTAYVTFATLTANDTPTMDLDDAVTKAGNYIYRAGGTDIPVSDGGTGASTLTDHGVLVGSGTSAVDALTVGTDGQVLLGATGADPAFATLTSTGGTITFTPGTNTLNLESSGGGITFTEVTGSTQALAVNSGYILNYGTLCTATLPSTAAVGSIISIVGSGAGGWKIAQNASQYINFCGVATTTGTGGSLASTVRYDCIELICITTDVGWVVRSSVGNITVV